MNKYGLSRHIPTSIRREIRQRSRFGCVVCRCGFYQYEHFDPVFAEAKQHEADGICCLCGGCHDSVTRGRLSKATVASAYKNLQTADPQQVGRPIGPLDFHDGNAELAIGGLLYSPVVRTVLRYHGQNVISVLPSTIAGEPGGISALFTDDAGQEVLRLEDNEWVGSLESWDIEAVGPRLTVRRARGHICLQLRLDPPGRIVVEHLDMRIGDGHVLASEQTYAVGRHLDDKLALWVHALILIRDSSPDGAAIEFTDAEELESRHQEYKGKGQELVSASGNIVLHSIAGAMVKPIGIVIAKHLVWVNLRAAFVRWMKCAR